MFHLGMWRERMRNALNELAEGRPPTPPPPIEQQDELNDAEIANGIGTPLSDAAARSDHLFGEIIELFTKVGDQPFQWYRNRTTTEAVLANSYTHPRKHIYEYLRENGDPDHAYELLEDAAVDLRAASAPPIALGAAIYNLACVRCHQGRLDEAIELLGEALPLRPDMKEKALSDSDLAAVHDDPRFQELVKN
jgi:tetratricopeptide (TPR) repeat protein